MEYIDRGQLSGLGNLIRTSPRHLFGRSPRWPGRDLGSLCGHGGQGISVQADAPDRREKMNGWTFSLLG